MIFIAQDVGQDGEPVAFLDQTHGDTRDRTASSGTPASIMASDAPQTVAMDDEPLDSVISETMRTV